MSGYSSSKIITDGLVLCLDSTNIKSWREDRNTVYTGTWYDLSLGDNNNCNGTILDAPNLVPDPPTSDTGLGFYFDGITNEFTENNLNTETNIFGDVTVEAWFKPFTVGTYAKIFGKGAASRQYGLWIRTNEFLYQRLGGGITMNCPYYSTVDFLWYHMVGTSKGTNEHFLYLNGIQVASSTTAVTAVTSTNLYTVARHTTANYFNGMITNIKLYNRALSAAEVLQNFNAHRGRFGI